MSHSRRHERDNFSSDVLGHKRRIRCISIVDDCMHECAAIEVDTSFTGYGVTTVMECLGSACGLSGPRSAVRGPVASIRGPRTKTATIVQPGSTNC